MFTQMRIKNTTMERREKMGLYEAGDTVRCVMQIAQQDESPWDIVAGTEGIVEKINPDGSCVVAWEYGEKSTLRTRALAHQITHT